MTNETPPEKTTYGRLFDIVFHIGVAINVIVVAWVLLMVFKII